VNDTVTVALPPPLPPEQNIGPYYRYAGIFLMFLLGCTVLTFCAAVLLQVPMTALIVKVLAGMAAGEVAGMILIILRPEKLDIIFRAVMAWLPFTHYGTPTPPQDGTR
jgi:hypothetical protein